MLIWDEKKKECIVRITGSEKERVKTSDFGRKTTNAEDEAVIKVRVNDKLNEYHIYIHVFSKPTNLFPKAKLNYVIWLGPIGNEPVVLPECQYWWEHSE